MSSRVEPSFGSGALKNYPEPRELKAYLSNLALIPLTARPPYLIVVEHVFSALFYTQIWTADRSAALKNWLGEPLVHTVTNTPYRKYKASLPWLSLACEPSVVPDCLCAEVLFSLFYLLDDNYDQKTKRYGKDTSYGLYGERENRKSLDQAYHAEERLPFFQGDREWADLWIGSLRQIEASEKQRMSHDETVSYAVYCEHSIERTSFLGKWWKRAALKAQDAELSRVIERIYSSCALIGQVRNDIRNTDEREESEGGVQFSDFIDGRMTAVTLLVRQHSTGRDRSWLENVVWKHHNKKLTPYEKKMLQYLCKEVRQHLTKQIAEAVQNIEEEIERSHLSEEVKAIWLGWVFRQLRADVTSDLPEHTLVASRFIEAARYLSRHVTGDVRAMAPFAATRRS